MSNIVKGYMWCERNERDHVVERYEYEFPDKDSAINLAKTLVEEWVDLHRHEQVETFAYANEMGAYTNYGVNDFGIRLLIY